MVINDDKSTNERTDNTDVDSYEEDEGLNVAFDN